MLSGVKVQIVVPTFVCVIGLFIVCKIDILFLFFFKGLHGLVWSRGGLLLPGSGVVHGVLCSDTCSWGVQGNCCGVNWGASRQPPWFQWACPVPTDPGPRVSLIVGGLCESMTTFYIFYNKI